MTSTGFRDGDDFEMPCVCPVCEEIHELDDAVQCKRCGKLTCPECNYSGYCDDCCEEAKHEALNYRGA